MSVVPRRCFVHANREAVARCLSCGRSYCRECVTEHDGRLRCARCLEAEAASKPAHRNRAGLVLALVATVGLLLGFASLYGFTRYLGRVPSRFHDGTAWKSIVSEP